MSSKTFCQKASSPSQIAFDRLFRSEIKELEISIQSFVEQLEPQSDFFNEAQQFHYLCRLEDMIRKLKDGTKKVILKDINDIGGFTRNRIEINDRNARRLLEMADQLKNQQIMMQIEKYLLKKSKICNVKLLKMADDFQLELLLDEIIQKLDSDEKIKKVKMSNEWDLLSDGTQRAIFNRFVELL